MSGAQWIAVDWGTSNVRLWGMDAGGQALFNAESDKGMSRLSSADYPAILNEMLAQHTLSAGPIDVIICGMAGARQGWLEAPYLSAPADLHRLGSNAVSPQTGSGRLKAHILSGVCQNTPQDVMRGEETQLLGLLALRPDFSGTVCMPGTHAKWAIIDQGRLVRFATSMTGELYELLSAHSVLRHSLNGDLTGPETEDGVDTGLERGFTAPQSVTSALFRTRAASLLSGKGPDWCAGYLSGVLIGAEVAGYRDWLEETGTVPLIGSARLCRLYDRALAMAGVKSEAIEAATATLAGLSEARKQIINAR